jgi:O-antigen ligase
VKQLKSAGLAALLLSVYVFMLYSRVFEATMLIGLPNLYLMLGLSAVALLCVLFKGGVPRAAKTPCGVLLLLFTLWGAFILPFSSWKSESLHELTDVWLKSAAAFFIIAGLTAKFVDSKRVFAAVGYGAAASALVVGLTNRYLGGRATSLGSLGNANEVAFHIAFGLPFMVLLISRVKMIFKIPLAAVVLLSLALSMKTASRGGLVITATIVAVAVLKVSIPNKLKIVTVAAVGIVVALLTADQTQLERYGTIFNSSSSSAEALSAKESADSRKHKLEQSLELTLTHPLTGVGMGVFIPAAADMSKERGEHQDWLASHNSYTQISSETGVLGFLIIVAVFAVTLSGLLKLHRTARRLNLKEVQSMALCMLLSSIALSIHFFFDAIPYDFYLPMVAGLGTSLVCTARPLVAEAEASLRRNETTSESGLAQMAVPAGIAAGSIAKTPGRIPSSNPYKLGRSRAVNMK